MKKIAKHCLTSALILASVAFFPLAGSAATTYTLKSPVPSLVNAGTVSEGVSTSGYRVMWKDSSNQVHLLSAFGGGENSGWYANYANMNTGVKSFVTGAAKGSFGGPAYHPTYNKLYGATGYAGYHNSFWEFDPVTRNVTIISDQNLIGPIAAAVIGDDGRVYQYTQGCFFFSYDPAVGMPNGWKQYGQVMDGVGLDLGSNYRGLAVDSQHIYLGLKKTNGTWTLFITPIGTSNWQEWEFGSAGDKEMVIGTNLTEQKWTLTRTLANGSKKYYSLSGGTYTELTPGQSGYSWSGTPPNQFLQGEYHPDKSPQHCVAASDESSYPSMASTYGWEGDFMELFPIKDVHEYTTAKYRQVGTQNWSESTFDFTGPWDPQETATVDPLSGNNVFGVAAGYNAVFNLNYKDKETTYLGFSNFSPYASMKHSSGEIYVGGYSNSVFRYDPAKPWTLTSANRAPKLPSDGSKPNPYFIQMPGDTYNYRHGLDYDASGVVWIGGNTTRKDPNYGNVMWYNPSDGSTGYLFDSWKSAGTQFRNLVAAANRTKIVVSSNDNKLTVINAATKAVEGTYNDLGEYAYMADVDGMVVGVTPGGNIFKFNPTTRTMIIPPQSIGVSGTPFGFGNNEYSRMNYKLEKGPDGYLWMFVGNSLYRINPTTLQFTKVLDTTFEKIKFAANDTDLLLYGNGTDFKYIPGILEASQTYSSADLNEDNSVNLTDLDILKSDFLKLTGSLTNPKSDIDGDGQATIKDVGIMMNGWK